MLLRGIVGGIGKLLTTHSQRRLCQHLYNRACIIYKGCRSSEYAWVFAGNVRPSVGGWPCSVAPRCPYNVPLKGILCWDSQLGYGCDIGGTGSIFTLPAPVRSSGVRKPFPSISHEYSPGVFAPLARRAGGDTRRAGPPIDVYEKSCGRRRTDLGGAQGRR